MDGNASLPFVVSHLILCADIQVPFMINIIIGLLANICVIWLILSGPGNKTAEIFSLNQAICEVVICLTNGIFLTAIYIMRFNVSSFTCLWYTARFSLGFPFSGRPLFMSCVCLDRYLAVVHPVTFLKYKLLRYRLAGCMTSWLIVLVCCIILMWVPYPAIHYVSFAMAFIWFLVQLFCCVETLRALVRPGPGDRKQELSGMNSAKLRAFRIIVIITVLAGLTNVPFVISVILHDSSKENSSTLFCVTAYLAVVAGFIPPFLNIRKAGKLQHCIKDTT